ncbi:hypothetical protein GL218_00278 [Daldinia childiae]|uniref:uncharacterized protein n=1 Tax=Daldinia childiae TaxID=326645 RepID=UPI001444CFBF|nr:uncharacterized protein GL218_00278 [Daldinia childiae]KAF3070599.1 hypothetical protein GL218_00278 [Daldinia childiae]
MPSGQAEVIIIGSGIAAAAAAYSILVETKRMGNLRRVLVIESREMCGGGTGRGNGVLNCAPHEMFHRLRSTIGLHRAAALVRFQLAHIKVMRELSHGLDQDYAEFRDREMVEFYLTERDRKIAFAKAHLFAQWVPEFKIATYGKDQAREPSEWISAGFGGDGLMWTWLSGIAVGVMLAGSEEMDIGREVGRPNGVLASWFPDELKPTIRRLRDSDFGNIAIRFIWSILTNRESTEPGDRNPYTNRIYEASANDLLL